MVEMHKVSCDVTNAVDTVPIPV